MKAVLISIKPYWVDKIANGEKTVEVRKTRPKIETPFKCYIYCTYGNERENYCLGKRGKVIGEFTCDRIDSYIFERDNRFWWGLGYKAWQNLKEKSCLTIEQIIDYTGDSNTLYGWNITDLKIYDEPKELNEFKTAEYTHGRIHLPPREFTRPPQSWCYVEV